MMPLSQLGLAARRFLNSLFAFIAIACAPCLPLGAAQAETTLRVVMASDLKIIDPIWTSAYIVRDHGYLIYDTLFAVDENGDVQPQMVGRYEISSDKLTHTLVLRDGLAWHDGTAVTAQDCVASIRRWAAKDTNGQFLMAITETLSATDEKTIEFKLKQPSTLVATALGKASSYVPFMMPQRVAATDPNKQLDDPTGSGPFIFQRDADGNIIPYAEWKVSTGREKMELHNERRIRTNTPEGIFQLDPDRMYARYWSHSWNNAPMHYAMFYDLMNNGAQSGLAIHAAVGASKIARLGKRDSAGCIRLSPKNAAELFYKVRNTLKGRVPVLAMNEKGSTDRWGRVQHDQSGAMMLQDGYRAVLFVENFDGREGISGPVVAYTN